MLPGPSWGLGDAVAPALLPVQGCFAAACRISLQRSGDQWVVAVCKFEGNFRPISRPERLECSRKHQSLFHSHVPPFVVNEVVHSVVRLAHEILIVQNSLHDCPTRRRRLAPS